MNIRHTSNGCAVKPGERVLTLQDGREVSLADERILANDVIFDGETNYHNTRLWIIGNEYGALGAVWAQHEQDALDELVDNDLGGGLLIDAPAPETFGAEVYARARAAIASVKAGKL